MRIHTRRRQWFIQTEGGAINSQLVPPECRGPYAEKPRPTLRWREIEEALFGTMSWLFTAFDAGGEKLLICRVQWIPAWGSWTESHERFLNYRDPPPGARVLEWTGHQFEPAACSQGGE